MTHILSFCLRFFKTRLLVLALLAACVAVIEPNTAFAGGPRYVAGVGYFNPGVLGQPIVWSGGQVAYFVDQGPLNSGVSNAQATAMVDSAAAVWNSVPTAAVALTDLGSLAEDVNGGNVQVSNGAFVAPSDVTPGSVGTPVAVIFDADGTVINALEGSGASLPTNCTQNSVLMWIDGMNPNASLNHAVIVLNGLCATSPGLLEMMSYQLERAFGRILGLDFSQVNVGAESESTIELGGVLGWPVMQPLSGECGAAGGNCIPNPAAIRYDDIAALDRLYPVTANNLASFPAGQMTAANTVSIQGTIQFRNGVGMQGVNVVARPLDSNGNPLYQYTVTFVSGSYFAGNHGNEITGWTDKYGNRLDRFGSNDPALQGFFDLSGIPLPPGVASANYQVTFEAVDPLFIDSISVGPYIQGSPTPSGTMETLLVPGLTPGSSQTLTVTVANSATDSTMMATGLKGFGSLFKPRAVKGGHPTGVDSEIQPRPLPQDGMWTSSLSEVGASDWFLLPVRGNRIFTVITQALDEMGVPSGSKAMPAIGVWDGFDPVGTAAPGWTSAANGIAPGETWLQVATAGRDVVRLGIADQRGDGRPDYRYRGWVLYADSVSPARLPASGGPITIRGTGFRLGDTVQIGGIAAGVLSLSPTEIVATVAASSTLGSADVEVDDLPGFNALAQIPAGISFDSASGDSLTLVAAPSNQTPLNIPLPFSLTALGADGVPAGGVTVTYTVSSGTATLGCGSSICQVTATGDGRATMQITATSTAIAVVTASLTNGASVQAHFYGGSAAPLTALTPTLYLAAGATAAWPVQALVQVGGSPASGQQVKWANTPGISAPSSTFTSNAFGIASATLTVGPLTEGETASSNACLNFGSTCVAFTAFGSRPEYAAIASISGTSQSMKAGTTPASVSFRVFDMDGNPMAGASVSIHQSLYGWSPPCPRHGRCASAQLLSSSAMNLTSALDGSISFAPLTMSGVATNLSGVATTGNTGSLTFHVEQHP